MKSGIPIQTCIDQEWWRRGQFLAGVDEVGRGALAGPVVAAAVVLHPHNIPEGIQDSKRLSPNDRALVSKAIKSSCIAWSIGVASASEVDAVNVLNATFSAMHRALDCVIPYCSHVLVDGNAFRAHALPHTCIVKGDASVLSIAAASIIAKTARDDYMRGLAHTLFPNYGFDRHVGYGTHLHRTQLASYGPCILHRASFLGFLRDLP